MFFESFDFPKLGLGLGTKLTGFVNFKNLVPIHWEAIEDFMDLQYYNES